MKPELHRAGAPSLNTLLKVSIGIRVAGPRLIISVKQEVIHNADSFAPDDSSRTSCCTAQSKVPQWQGIKLYKSLKVVFDKAGIWGRNLWKKSSSSSNF